MQSLLKLGLKLVGHADKHPPLCRYLPLEQFVQFLAEKKQEEHEESHFLQKTI
jgi:hypothetical protein